MRILDNGIYRDMTEEEVAEYMLEQDTPAEPLTQMVEEMAAATTLAQMRAAAKKFLASTE